MPVKSRNLRKKRKCPLGLWHVLIDKPLQPGHPKYNKFQEFLRPGDWGENRKEVIDYWLNKKTKKGEKKAVFLQKEGLLTDKEFKMLGIKKPSRMDKWK